MKKIFSDQAMLQPGWFSYDNTFDVTKESIDTPLIKQAEKSYHCGQALAGMFLNLNGIKKDLEQITREVKTYDRFGTYMSQLGSYLIDNGLKCGIVTMNPYLFTLYDQKGTAERKNEQFIEAYSHNLGRKKKRTRWFNSFFQRFKSPMKKEILIEPLRLYLEFFEKGGVIIPEIPNFFRIKNEIIAGRPVGVSVTRNFLHRTTPGTFDSHITMITGFDEEAGYYEVNDPHFESKERETYPIFVYTYAMWASAGMSPDNASMLLVAP